MFVDSSCKFCGHHSCSVDAAICPHCGHLDPNPGITTRVKAVVSEIIAAPFLIIFGVVIGLTLTAGMVRGLGALVGGLLAMVWAVFRLGRAAWYSVDPTLSILPVKRY